MFLRHIPHGYRQLAFGTLLALSIALPSSGQEQPITSVNIDNESPWKVIVVPIAISLGGAAIGVIVPLMTARNNHQQTMAELRLEHTDRIRDEMKGWLEQRLAEKEAEINQLRQRCSQLEAKLAEIEHSSNLLRQQYTTLRERHSRLLVAYRQTKAKLEVYEMGANHQ